MSKYGKKKSFDVTTGIYTEEDLTPEEIAQCEIDEKEHWVEQEKLAKTKYLRDRKADSMCPCLEDKVEALWLLQRGEFQKFKEIDNVIRKLESMYPAPDGNI